MISRNDQVWIDAKKVLDAKVAINELEKILVGKKKEKSKHFGYLKNFQLAFTGIMDKVQNYKISEFLNADRSENPKVDAPNFATISGTLRTLLQHLHTSKKISKPENFSAVLEYSNILSEFTSYLISHRETTLLKAKIFHQEKKAAYIMKDTIASTTIHSEIVSDCENDSDSSKNSIEKNTSSSSISSLDDHEELTHAYQKIQELEICRNQLTKQLTKQLEENKIGLNNAITQSEIQAVESSKIIEKLQDSNKSLTDQLDAIQEQLASAQINCKILENKTNDLNSKLAILQSCLDEGKSTNNKLFDTLNTTKSANKNLINQIQQIKFNTLSSTTKFFLGLTSLIGVALLATGIGAILGVSILAAIGLTTLSGAALVTASVAIGTINAAFVYNNRIEKLRIENQLVTSLQPIAIVESQPSSSNASIVRLLPPTNKEAYSLTVSTELLLTTETDVITPITDEVKENEVIDSFDTKNTSQPLLIL